MQRAVKTEVMKTVCLDITSCMSLTSQSKLQRPFGGPPDCFESRGGGGWFVCATWVATCVRVVWSLGKQPARFFSPWCVFYALWGMAFSLRSLSPVAEPLRIPESSGCGVSLAWLQELVQCHGPLLSIDEISRCWSASPTNCLFFQRVETSQQYVISSRTRFDACSFHFLSSMLY